jgi:hypothetical protein
MNIQDYLKSKKFKKREEEQINELKSIQTNEIKRLVSKVFGLGKENMTPRAAKLGLLIYNQFPKNSDSNYYGARYSKYIRISYMDERYKYLKENYPSYNFWDDEHYELLKYLFGNKFARLIRKAWTIKREMPYQTDMQRRSFRSKRAAEEYYLANQINLIIEFNQDYDYDLTLEEYIIYSNDIEFNGSLSYIIAAAIELEYDGILELLLDIIYGRHDVGKVSRPIIKGMLLSANQEAWVAIEKLLLSAQRQEGLRQTILECLDETSIGAMKHMIKVIIDNKLTRFSSVVRALDVWAGLGWEGEKEKTVLRFLELGQKFLEQKELIPEAVFSKDNAEVYMALWAQGVYDVDKCFPLMTSLLKKHDPEKSSLVFYFILQTEFYGSVIEVAKEYIKNKNLQIFFWCVYLIKIFHENDWYLNSKEDKRELFDVMSKRLNEIPKKGIEFRGMVFSWLSYTFKRDDLYMEMSRLIDYKSNAEMDLILPYFPNLPIDSRNYITSKMLPDHHWSNSSTKKKINTKQRDFAFSILKDRSSSIRSTGLEALLDGYIADNEIIHFEDMLASKDSGIRRRIINMILQKSEDVIKNSINRLLDSKKPEQRLAGLDIMNQLFLADRMKNWLENRAKKYCENKRVSEKEQILIDNLIQTSVAIVQYNEENGWGLFDPEKIAPVKDPETPIEGFYYEQSVKNPYGLSMSTSKINNKIYELYEIFMKNKDYEYTFEGWEGNKISALLGNTFASTIREIKNLSDEDKYNCYPLPEVWKKWFTESGLTPLDLALINITAPDSFWSNSDKRFPRIEKNVKSLVFEPKIPSVGEHNYRNPIVKILEILGWVFPSDEMNDYLLGLTSKIFSQIITEEDVEIKEKDRWGHVSTHTWRDVSMLRKVYSKLHERTDSMSDKQFEEFWELYKWESLKKRNNVKKKSVEQKNFNDICRAYSLGLIDRNELVSLTMEPEPISILSSTKKSENQELYEKYPVLEEIYTTCRDRILEIELLRGDSKTTVTHLAEKINVHFGIENFVKILKAIGSDTFFRGSFRYYWWGNSDDKKDMMSVLLKRCHPLPTDTQQQFNKAISETKVTEKRLVEVAVLATRWIPFIQKYLKWKGLDSAIWWLYAHAGSWNDSETEAEIAKYSPVNTQDFKDGAVDTDWFRTAYKAVGEERWQKIYKAAKYVSDGNGHTRAQLYADVMLGNKKIDEIAERITDKRNQNNLRAYGLLPIKGRNRKQQILNRYLFLQNFKKESKQFGSQRQASEALAVRIAMENLARTAGYSDPIRLTWAMESQQADEILKNSKPVKIDEIEVSMVFDNDGKPLLETVKNGKKLKNIPTKYGKNPEIKELKSNKKILLDQYRRSRKSLEEVMVRGEYFTKQELFDLMKHPVLEPQLKKIVLKSEDEFGFYQNGSLHAPNGEVAELSAKIYIAHCTDLYTAGNWADYQKFAFDQKLVQPFKQIFRELYVPTQDELTEEKISRRYEGHQVQPKKTAALLKTRGWTVSYEEGLQKVHHKEGVIAKIYSMADWFSPADVESPTLETIQFYDRKTDKSIAFEDLSPRLFSEVMRDMDLVVSVAHVGGVDPEASHSSIEMRSVIVRETSRLFKLKNVGIKGNHVLIDGELNEYTVHLGSGVVHKSPSVYVSILPVHSQHRGRIFLPFVDDDPKSAEIVSKVLLLAKDNEIQDPTILTQIKR